MPLLSANAIKQTTEQLVPYLSAVAREVGVITDDAIRECLKKARSAGVPVRQVRSARTFALIERHYVEGTY